jgi:hypothetical protein
VLGLVTEAEADILVEYVFIFLASEILLVI